QIIIGEDTYGLQNVRSCSSAIAAPNTATITVNTIIYLLFILLCHFNIFYIRNYTIFEHSDSPR
ncbi:hypothetical protein L9F63_012675, partial [Diploptera punctata]